MLKAVIFDMDGLLIDSEPFWRQSHQEVLASYGHPITEGDIRAMAGKRTDFVVNHWHQRFQITKTTPAMTAAAITTKVLARIKVKGEALPGAHKLIQLLKKHDLPLAVASSSSPEIIDAVLEKLLIKTDMDVIHSAVHEEYGKPHPAVFITTAKKLRVDTGDCLVFEDSISGVIAAKAAGAMCIAVPEAINRTRPEYGIADKIIDSLEDVNWQMLKTLMH